MVIRIKHVHRFRDRTGTVRHYLRVPGRKAIALPGAPGSPPFLAAYQAAMAAIDAPAGPCLVAGTLAAVARSWMATAEFRQHRQSTQATYRRIAEGLVRQHGDKPMRLLDPIGIRRLVAERASQPAAANHRLRILRFLCRQAMSDGVTDADPTRDIRKLREAGEGAVSWTEADITAFEARWPSGSRERLWMALLLYTGQRRSDVVRMGWPHVSDGAITLRQVKTGTELTIPLHPALVCELGHVPADRLLFLTTDPGKAFTANGWYMRFKAACRAANLPDRSPHGLRKAAARRLAEAGASSHEIASITGHKSLAEVERYTKAADQVRMAKAGMGRVVNMTRKPVSGSLQTGLKNG